MTPEDLDKYRDNFEKLSNGYNCAHKRYKSLMGKYSRLGVGLDGYNPLEIRIGGTLIKREYNHQWGRKFVDSARGLIFDEAKAAKKTMDEIERKIRELEV